eukprot:NODE_341_length_9178_cov_1.080846.p8 type:complete len:184 gc:universal NODE_341_length_9178_cov_1.080846:3464-2913(-)
MLQIQILHTILPPVMRLTLLPTDQIHPHMELRHLRMQLHHLMVQKRLVMVLTHLVHLHMDLIHLPMDQVHHLMELKVHHMRLLNHMELQPTQNLAQEDLMDLPNHIMPTNMQSKHPKFLMPLRRLTFQRHHQIQKILHMSQWNLQLKLPQTRRNLTMKLIMRIIPDMDKHLTKNQAPVYYQLQ